MITIISPAKTLDFETPVPTTETSEIIFQKEANQIARVLKRQKASDLAKLMGLSSNLAQLNFERYQQWANAPEKECLRQAAFMFKGDVYQGLDAYSFSADDLEFAQGHLRILSGMYGVLKPLDLVQAYRLEMGTKTAINSHKNLYAFWGKKVLKALQKELEHQENPVFINLASNEYFKVLPKKEINHPVITPVFKDFKNGNYKVISFFAKKARGVMARWIIQNRIDSPNKLQNFSAEGYYFSPNQSTETEWVFLRDNA